MPRLFALSLTTCLALAAALVSTLPAQAQDNPVIARMTAFVETYNAQDAESLAGFYAPDAALLPPGQASVLGREAIAQHYAQAFAAGARDLQFKTFDIRAFDTSAVEIGETVVMVGEQRIVGRYMHLWEVIDGQLLLTRDMYHVLKVE
ncbi:MULTISPECIES: YybH family protein [unclassified Roseovarius]|uniref:YybH family protein n=1 Tax=unclassified Roseovarius TaxID=2614913 RepID=UPI00273D9AFF|nr:SgcJ/EcaC family oxidoreductase [Roseovarius sp. MMSF_3350]